MDPFVVTSLGKKTYKTKVIRHNLNPVYDEKLVFQVLRHEVNYSLTFTVIDRDKLSGNDFVGSATFPLEKIASLSPHADPKTGLYPMREPPTADAPLPEMRKSRFRLPLSRTSSSTSVHKATTKQVLRAASSQSSLNGALNGTSSTNSESQTTLGLTNVASADTLAVPLTSSSIPQDNQDDPDLKSFTLPLKLKNQDRWEAKHSPVIYLKAKYLPYKALRQQFWRAMLRQYLTDDSTTVSKVELTTMLDSLGSTLHETTINGFFTRLGGENSSGEPCLTMDQAVRSLEELLQTFEDQKLSSRFKAGMSAMTSGHPLRSPVLSREPSSASESPDLTISSHKNKSSAPVLPHEHHGPAGEEGDTLDSNDLADEHGEEHVVEIRECPICHQPRLGKRSDADIITHIATCASQDWRQVNNIVMAGFVTSSQAQRKWYSKVVTKIGYGGYKLGANSANILVQDRQTGQINEERMSVYVRLGIRLLYKGLKSRDMEKKRSKSPYLVHYLSRTDISQYANFSGHYHSSKVASTMILPHERRFHHSSISINST